MTTSSGVKKILNFTFSVFFQRFQKTVKISTWDQSHEYWIVNQSDCRMFYILKIFLQSSHLKLRHFSSENAIPQKREKTNCHIKDIKYCEYQKVLYFFAARRATPRDFGPHNFIHFWSYLWSYFRIFYSQCKFQKVKSIPTIILTSITGGVGKMNVWERILNKKDSLKSFLL